MKRKIALVLAVLFAVGALPVLPAASAAVAAEKPYYIIDEHFSFMRNKSWPVLPATPSGWDVNNEGGELTAGYNSWFKINDKSGSLPVEMVKRFRAENEGAFTFEIRFNFTNMMNGTSFRVRSDDKSAISFILEGGSLCVETGGEKMPLESIVTGREYGVRADFDFASKKIINVYVNGALKAQNVSFKDSVSSINNVQLRTGETATGEVFISPVKLYKNYIINERLMTAINGALPSDWSFDQSGGTISSFLVRSATSPDLYSLKLLDTSSSGAVSATKAFAETAQPLSFEFKYLFVNKADGVSGGIYSGSTPIFAVVTDGGKLCYTDANGGKVPIGDYIENLWYSYRVTLDFAASKATLWINGRQAAVDIALPSAVNSADNVKFTTGDAATGEIWLDDIVLGTNPPLPADYVPTPNPVKTDDPYIIGVQSCSLWREGHHLGWGFIKDWPDRTPLIGFYDEGNPEVADWEIKFLVENGITFQVFSWFRPNGGDAPVKDPYTAEFALHQGYHYAEYSDMLKYMIYWENGGAGTAQSSEDFRKNIVPFWIEYYFKDPRYFRLDGKPVLSILTMSGLTRDFGSDQNIKAELDYLRQACRDAGVGEIVLITNGGTLSRSENERRKNLGFEGLYAYNWNTASKPISSQMSRLQAQQNAGGIDIIPTLNMGFDDTAWSGTTSQGGYLELEDFESLLRWAKDTFMPKSGQNSIGRRVALLSNWNEYGEGHFFMATSLKGFGYLETVRKVFAPGKTANNVLPSEAAKIRMCRLFSAGTDVQIPPKKNNAVPDPGFETIASADDVVIKKLPAHITVEKSSEQSRSGTASLKMAVGGTSASYPFFEIALNKSAFEWKAGRQYGFSYWAYSPNSAELTLNVRFRHNLNKESSNADYAQAQSKIKVGSSNGWQNHSGVVTLSPEAVIQQSGTIYGVAKPFVDSQSVTNAVVYYDDMYFYQLDGPTAVVSSSPADGETATGPVSSVEITFNYPVRPSSLTPQNVTATGAEIADIELPEGSHTATIHFARPVTEGNVSISLSAGVMDLFGRIITPQTLSFTVGEPEEGYGCTAFRFMDGAEQINALRANTTVKAVVENLANNTGQDGDITLVIVLYKDGRIVRIGKNVVSLANGQSTPSLEADLDVGALNDGDYTLKAFLWEGLTALNPVSTIISIGETN